MKNSSQPIAWHFSNFCWLVIQRILPSKIYLSLRYRLIFGKNVNWDSPKSFTEKLQWLKLFYYGKKESILVDKILAKNYIADKAGEQYVVPTLGAWGNVSDVPFSALPQEYVLKCNHDCGSVFFCNKGQIDNFEEVKKQIRKRLKRNYYWTARETPYKFVKPMVFAEALLENGTGNELYDYKFFCFNGEPKLFKIDFNRFVELHSNYYDIKGNILPFGVFPSVPVFSKALTIPENLSEMVEVARKLSQDLPFVRVDMYNIDGKIIVGELTLFPTAGFKRFTDDEWDLRLGSWINLPSKR